MKGVENIKRFLGGKEVGVFCDDSNLYHSYQKYGWRIDLGKFRKLLEKCCSLKFINYYMAIPHKSDSSYLGTQRFLKKIRSFVNIREKPLKYTPVGGKFIKKADCDVEITLDVVRNIESIDSVVIVSGDSDFLELKKYVTKEKEKEILFWAFEKNMAWELKYSWHLFLDDYKEKIVLI